MLSILVTIFTVLLVFVCLLLALVVLMQRPKQEGLGAAFGGALMDGALGSGTTDFLQKATVILGVAFFVLSISIATLTARVQNAGRLSNVDKLKEAETPEKVDTPAVPAPADAPGLGAVTPAEIVVPPLESEEKSAEETTTPASTETVEAPAADAQPAETPETPAETPETPAETPETPTPGGQ